MRRYLPFSHPWNPQKRLETDKSRAKRCNANWGHYNASPGGGRQDRKRSPLL